MSKVKFFSLVVPLLLLVGAARADVLVFPDVEATEKALRHNTWMTDEGIVSRLLAQVACQSSVGKSVMSKYPKLYQSDGACVDLFLARNSIQSTMISVDEYRAKAKGGWWLPTNSDVTSNGEEVQAISKQLATTQQRVDKLEKGDQAAVQALKGEVKSQVAAVKQQADVAKAQSAQAQAAVTKLDTKLKGVNRQLEELAPLTTSVADTKTQIDKLNERLGGVESNMTGLTGMVGALTDVVGETNGRWWVSALVIALFTSVGFIALGLWQRRQGQSIKDIQAQNKNLGTETFNLKQIVTGSIFDNGEVGGLMKTTNNLIEGQERTDVKLKEHEAVQQGLAEQQQQLSQQVEQLTEQQRLLDGEVNRLRKHEAQTTDLLVQVAETANDALALAASASSVEFDPANPSLDVLETLPIGKEHVVVWKGRYSNGHFAVEIWKEETTPDGQVETNVVRNAKTGQKSKPMALKRLRQRVEAAVVDGRVPVIKLLANVA